MPWGGHAKGPRDMSRGPFALMTRGHEGVT